MRINNGYFKYKKKEVFQGLSLELFPEDVHCILGSNGCGKTTLLRCLNGSLRLQEGQVLLNGRDLSEFSIDLLARKIGMVYQEHNISFPYSVLDIVKMGRAPYLRLFERPSKEDIQIAKDKLNLVGLYHLKSQPYTEISGGERKLVLIARTLAQEPEVILLDEPTSHLDFKNQVLVLKIITLLARQGLSILMTTHYPNHALLFSNRVSLMSKDTGLITGEPEQILNEENLEKTYGIKVEIVTYKSLINGENIRVCIPVK